MKNFWLLLLLSLLAVPAQAQILAPIAFDSPSTVAAAGTFTFVQQANGSTKSLVLTAVDTGGNYTGTISGCTSNTYNGYYVTVTGFTNGGNNQVDVPVTACTSTTLALGGTTISETHAGAANFHTVSIPVSPNLAAGNLLWVACMVPNSGFVNNSIASISAGGTLVLEPAGSTGLNNTAAGPNTAQMLYHILPGTNTGGTSPIVITFRLAASGSGGLCELQEWHPSANGAGVALDIDSAYSSGIAASGSNANIAVTESGTNDVCFAMFVPSSTTGTAIAVTPPFSSHYLYSTSANSGAFAGAVSSGGAETWTSSDSSQPLLTKECFGWNVTPSAPQGFYDFEVGSGNQGMLPTTALLTPAAHGFQGGMWAVTGSANMIFDAAASMPLRNSTGLLADGTTSAANAGSMGFTITGAGAAMPTTKLQYTWHTHTPVMQMTAAIKWTSDVADNDTSNIDCFSIHGATDFANVNCYETLSHRYLRIETPQGNGANFNVLPSVSCSTVGTVNTAGTAVTFASGVNFKTAWGTTYPLVITVGGVSTAYPIASVNSTTSITLSGAGAGTQTGVAYSVSPGCTLISQYQVGQAGAVTVTTSGTDVAWVSGPKFDASWQAGRTMWINAVNYVLSSVNSATDLTITATAGSQTAVSFQANTNLIEAYDQTGAFLGVSFHAGIVGMDFPQYINMGYSNGGATVTSGAHFRWDSLQLSLNGTIPNM